MKESRFTQEQIIDILREAERGNQTISAVCRSHSIAETTFYKWRQKFGGMDVPDARRLLAERDIEIDAMKEVVAKKW